MYENYEDDSLYYDTRLFDGGMIAPGGDPSVIGFSPSVGTIPGYYDPSVVGSPIGVTTGGIGPTTATAEPVGGYGETGPSDGGNPWWYTGDDGYFVDDYGYYGGQNYGGVFNGGIVGPIPTYPQAPAGGMIGPIGSNLDIPQEPNPTLTQPPYDPNHGIIQPVTPGGGIFGSGVEFSLGGLIPIGATAAAVGGLISGGAWGSSPASPPPPQDPGETTTIPVIPPPPPPPPPPSDDKPTQIPVMIPNDAGTGMTVGPAPTTPTQPPPDQKPPTQIPIFGTPTSDNSKTVAVDNVTRGIPEGGRVVIPVPLPIQPPGTPPLVPPPPGSPPSSSNPGIPPPPTQPTTPMALPLDRNYYTEGNQSSQDLQRLGPDIFNNYSQYTGNLSQTDLNNFSGMLGQVGVNNSTLTGLANQQTTTSNNALRTGNLRDVSLMAPTYSALHRDANQELYSGLNRLDGAAGNMGANSYEQGLGNIFGQGIGNAGTMGVNSYQQGLGNTYAQGIGNAGQMGVNGYQQGLGNMFNAGTSSLGRGLETSALQQLNLGTSTSAAEQRGATQQARAGMEARGLGNSNGAIAAEVLNNYQLGQQRLQQRQGFAQNAFGQQQADMARQASLGTNLANMDYGRQEANFNQKLAAQAQNNALGTNLANMDYGRQEGNFNQRLAAQAQNTALGTNLANMDYGRQQQNFGQLATAAGLRANTSYDPNAMILAQNSQNVGLNQGLFGNASGFSSGAYANQNAAQLTNPFNPYAQDVYSTNSNASNARYIAAGNNAAAMKGAQDATTGALANTFLKFAGSYLSR